MVGTPYPLTHVKNSLKEMALKSILKGSSASFFVLF
jgi:hypothetical protein